MQYLNYSYPQIAIQEVPGELALALSISGCPLRCSGCHSKFTYDPSYGAPLTPDILLDLIAHHKHITCVLFYGGEWQPHLLAPLLRICRQAGLKTCLYTGYELSDIDSIITSELNFIKTGPYIESLGGLASPTTNQQFITLRP